MELIERRFRLLKNRRNAAKFASHELAAVGIHPDSDIRYVNRLRHSYLPPNPNIDFTWFAIALQDSADCLRIEAALTLGL